MKLNKTFCGLIGVTAFIIAWELCRVATKDVAIVDITTIFVAFAKIVTTTDFYINLFSTLKIVLLGVSIAIIVGVALAVIMDLSRIATDTIMPLVEMLRNIPSITLFPILLVIYGVGDEARVFVIFWTAAPAILLSTLFGLRNIDKSVVEAACSFGANDIYIMRKIKLPLAVPDILNGVKIGTGNGFVAIVVAEMLGASKGLGFMVLWATNSFKYNETYAYIIIIALVGMVTNSTLNSAIKKYERKYS